MATLVLDAEQQKGCVPTVLFLPHKPITVSAGLDLLFAVYAQSAFLVPCLLTYPVTSLLSLFLSWAHDQWSLSQGILRPGLRAPLPEIFLFDFSLALAWRCGSLMAQRVKHLPARRETWVRSLGLIPGWGRSPGEGNGNSLQYSCLENPMVGGAKQATVYGVAKSRTRLSDFTSEWIESSDKRESIPLSLELASYGNTGSFRIRRFLSLADVWSVSSRVTQGLLPKLWYTFQFCFVWPSSVFLCN